ncbi:MAG: YbaN family protein [Alistipes sp.]|nr:YbaN family protein [Alistipes sp.]
MKSLLVILGIISLGLGVVGIFLPLLPTTPFLLLSAWCFVHSSPKRYEWLLNHPRLGSYVRNFHQKRAIPLRAKVLAVTMIWATIGFCIFGVVEQYLWAQILLFAIAASVSMYILSYKTLK